MTVRPPPLNCFVDQTVEHRQAALDAQVVRRALRSSDERQERAICTEQCEVGLRVAAVDSEDELFGHA